MSTGFFAFKNYSFQETAFKGRFAALHSTKRENPSGCESGGG